MTSPERSKLSRQIATFPFVRAAFFLLAVFIVVVPFTSIPERFTRLSSQWLEAFRGRDPRPQPIKASPPAPVKPSPHSASAFSEKAAPPKATPSSKGRNKALPTSNPTASTPPRHPRPRIITIPPSDTRPQSQLPTEQKLEHVSDVREMTRGLQLNTDIIFRKGGTAHRLRNELHNYRAELKLHITLPEPAKTLTEIEQAHPGLATMLPDLPKLLENSQVSPFFYQLFENKQKRVRRQATELGRLLTRHNFYDCQSLLELEHPDTKRRALLILGDMDVVSDGSDGDRLPKMPDSIVNSTNYQPFTSYGWKKTSSTPNPMIKGWEQRIRNADAEIKESSTSATRRKWLQDRKAFLKRGIEDMKVRSFLIAEYDPFIVVPINFLTYRGQALAPRVGDYAVVLHKNQAYPAIVGDAGPSFKVGEASLRLAKAITPSADPYSRPVSDLSVSYLIFPNSKESPKRAPDYAHWRNQCSKLLAEIGGLAEGYELYQWKDLLKKEVPLESPIPSAPPGTNP